MSNSLESITYLKGPSWELAAALCCTSKSVWNWRVSTWKHSLILRHEVVQVMQKKNTPPSQLDFSSCISQLRHRPEQISRNIRRAWFERVRAERTKCIVVKKKQQYWYQDHWCVCVCAEWLSWDAFSCAFCFPPLPPFISSPLLLECRSQVKCKPFPRNVRQSIRDEISPKWRQEERLIIWITACKGCRLQTSPLRPQPLHRMSKQLVTPAGWEGVPDRSFLNPRLERFLQERRPLSFSFWDAVCLFVESQFFYTLSTSVEIANMGLGLQE